MKRVTPLNSARTADERALGHPENMPEVEQRAQLGGHYFRVLRDISGDDYWGPWMTAPEGGLAASEVASLAEPARACMRQLKRLITAISLEPNQMSLSIGQEGRQPGPTVFDEIRHCR